MGRLASKLGTSTGRTEAPKAFAFATTEDPPTRTDLGVIGRWANRVKKLLTKRNEATMPPDLREAISQFVREEYYPAWLGTPNDMMDGRTPAELLENGRVDLIRKAIKDARHAEP